MQFLQKTTLIIIGCICTYFVLSMLLQQISLDGESHSNTNTITLNKKNYSVNYHEYTIFTSIHSNVCDTNRVYETNLINSLIGHDKTKHQINSIVSLIKDMSGPTKDTIKSSYPGIELPKSILLYGPPGTGKTTIANHISNALGCTFLHISPDIIENKFYGEGIKKLRAVFTLAKKLAPTIIFFDEIDGFMSSRSALDQSHTNTMKTIFLTSMDCLHESDNVLVIAATNRRESLDSALLRRLDVQLFMGFPSFDDKIQMVHRYFPTLSDDDKKEFVDSLGPGKSLSDVQNTCKTCIRSMYSNKEKLDKISIHTLKSSVSNIS